MNKNFKKCIVIFMLGSLLTSILYIPSFNVDGLCTKVFGYKASSVNFLNAGRLITYVFYLLFDKIRLSVEALSIFSAFVSNIFLALSVVEVYNVICHNQDKETNFICYILSFFLIYNPITIELLLFDEAFVMCFGIFMGVKAISILNSDKQFKYLYSLIFATICTMCYQGVLCIFLPLGLLNIVLNNKSLDFKNQIRSIFAEFIKIGIIYSMALLINFVIIKFINVYISSSPKIGTLNIKENILFAFKFIKESLKYGGGYIYPYLYHILNINFVLCLCFVLIKRKKNTDIKYTLYLIINLIITVAIPFVINVAMDSSNNYTAARMYMSLGFTAPIIAIYLVLVFDILKTNWIKLIFLSCIMLYSTYVIFDYIFIIKGGLDSYNMDMKYINELKTKINDYEIETGNSIDTIYWTPDQNSRYCNNVGFCNSYSYRVFAIDWAANAAVRLIYPKMKYIKMSYNQKNKYLHGKDYLDYDNLSDDQLIFDGSKLYLIIY